MHCVIPTMRSIKIKFFLLVTLVFVVYICLFYILLEDRFVRKKSHIVMTSVNLPYVVFHVDLKGSPPKLEYLQSLLPMLKSHGVNGLLMEYEDMFPYEGKLANLSARNCYSERELKNFLQYAVQSEFVIIPLIQTFGHLEYALKLQEFRHLREVPVYPDSICPSKLESRAIVKHMLEQVVKFHNAISPLKYIHVGCDEVYHINKCAECIAKGFTNIDLFVDYLKIVSVMITDLSSETTVLIWDDMLRSIKPLKWKKIDCFDNIEPVYWDYSTSLRVSHTSLRNYRNNFKNIWIASAFKGADGITATLPNLKDRFLNHFSWMNLILNYKFGGDKRIFGFRGIILTGWSRYSHMDPPCELLPASIPSIILNLLLIKKFRSGIILDDDTNTWPYAFFDKYLDSDFNKRLKCENGVDVDNFDTSKCNFENVELYNILKQYILISNDIVSGFNNDQTGLPSIDYYSKVNHINMNSLMEHVIWCNSSLNAIADVEKNLYNVMKKYYNDDFINEYVNYKTFNVKKQLKSVLNELYNYMYTRVWQRRPVITKNVSDNILNT